MRKQTVQLTQPCAAPDAAGLATAAAVAPSWDRTPTGTAAPMAAANAAVSMIGARFPGSRDSRNLITPQAPYPEGPSGADRTGHTVLASRMAPSCLAARQRSGEPYRV